MSKINNTERLGEAIRLSQNKELKNPWVETDYWKPSLITFGRIPTGKSIEYYELTNNSFTSENPPIDTPVDGNMKGSDQVIVPPKGSGDHVQFALAIAEKNKVDGSWKRSHKDNNRNGAPNQNLIQMWTDLGLRGATLGGKTDYLPWCAGFVYWVLLKCGYPIPSSANVASAKWIAQGGWQKLGYDRIPAKDADTGDLCVWKWSHINFLVRNDNGNFTCVGGNQTDNSGKSSPYNNNPSNSGVTINRVNSSSLLTPYVYRPRR